MSISLPSSLRKDLEKFYMAGIPNHEIIESLDLSDDQTEAFGYMVYGQDRTGSSPTCLYQRKRKQVQESPDGHISVPQYRTVKSHIIDDTQSSLMTKIRKRISLLDEEDIRELSVSDLKTLSDIFAQFDKIGRLERGEATENVNVETGFTLRDIKNGVSVEAEYERIEHDDEEESDEESNEEDRRSSERDRDSSTEAARTLPNGIRL